MNPGLPASLAPEDPRDFPPVHTPTVLPLGSGSGVSRGSGVSSGVSR
jgi:hypothetical protein